MDEGCSVGQLRCRPLPPPWAVLLDGAVVSMTGAESLTTERWAFLSHYWSRVRFSWVLSIGEGGLPRKSDWNFILSEVLCDLDLLT